MDCSKAAQYLYEYVDRELDGQTMAEVEAHLKICGHCFDAFDVEFKIKELVRQRMAASPQAEKLKVRILAELAQIASRPPVETSRAKRLWLWGGVATAAAAVVLFFAFGLPDLTSSDNPLVLQAAAEHQNHLTVGNRILPPGISLDSVNAVLAAQLGFDPELNHLKNIASRLKAFHAASWNGRPTACLYLAGANGNPLSLLICKEIEESLPEGEKYLYEGREYVLAEHEGVRMVFWVWDGMLCCSVGKCSEKELLDFTWSV
ncbi:MAG: zf-HC2 domain-containing protein [candidate division Zixibacteria bacterium]|nr:zf-HC2 domain-containing protein [candidate division Zixibacteria bacterium]